MSPQQCLAGRSVLYPCTEGHIVILSLLFLLVLAPILSVRKGHNTKKVKKKKFINTLSNPIRRVSEQHIYIIYRDCSTKCNILNTIVFLLYNTLKHKL